jgi:hypothetical protein
MKPSSIRRPNGRDPDYLTAGDETTASRSRRRDGNELPKP